jgi:hypothetical protein
MKYEEIGLDNAYRQIYIFHYINENLVYIEHFMYAKSHPFTIHILS